MKLVKDILWIVAVVFFISLFLISPTDEMIHHFGGSHRFVLGFIKFAYLATLGEMISDRILNRGWKMKKGLFLRAIVWGLIGILITLVFQIYAAGVGHCIEKGFLPGKGYQIAFAFFVSFLMNTLFAPTFMAFHRFTDTIIDFKCDGKKITLRSIVDEIDWYGFISFVVVKTVPFFWIPAHTIVFLLPPQFRILTAAALSIVLGILLAFGKAKKTVPIGVQNAAV